MNNYVCCLELINGKLARVHYSGYELMNIEFGRDCGVHKMLKTKFCANSRCVNCNGEHSFVYFTAVIFKQYRVQKYSVSSLYCNEFIETIKYQCARMQGSSAVLIFKQNDTGEFTSIVPDDIIISALGKRVSKELRELGHVNEFD